MGRRVPGRRERVARGLVIFVACYLLLGFVAVEVSQRVFRHRAERLLADVHDLRPGVGTAAGVADLRRRWSRWETDHSDPCREIICEYQIELCDWVLPVIAKIANSPETADRVLSSPWFKALHANLPLIRIDITVQAGQVKSLRQTMQNQVAGGLGPGWMGPGQEPPGYVRYSSGPYVLLAETVSIGAPGGPSDWPQGQLNPHYALRRPSGCEGCMGFHAEYGRDATAAEYDFLSGFDLSCATRWTPCTTEADLLPGPWKQYRIGREGMSEW